MGSGEVGDVDLVLAEQRADAADDAEDGLKKLGLPLLVTAISP
jgi:hypothetical protein